MGEARPRRYVWYGHASSEGGPILVTDVGAYASWGGSDASWTDDATYRVHFYGPLIARLSASHQPSGAGEWHQYACVQGLEAARAYVKALRAEADRLEPTLTMREQERMDLRTMLAKAKAAMASSGVPAADAASGPGAAQVATSAGAADAAPGAGEPAAMKDWLSSWRDHIEGGADFYVGEERVLHVDAKPDTDYDRACQAMDEDGVALVSFSGESRGLVWSIEGAGTAYLGRAPKGEGFILLTSWSGDDDDREAAKRAARKHVLGEVEERRLGTLPLPSGLVAAVWAPVAPADLGDAPDIGAALKAAALLNPPVQLNQAAMLGVGTLARVRPGEYDVACGAYREGETGWRCRWARFTPTSPGS